MPADGSMSFDLLTKIVSVSANIPLSVASELSLQDMEEVGEAVGGFLERSPPD